MLRLAAIAPLAFLIAAPMALAQPATGNYEGRYRLQGQNPDGAGTYQGDVQIVQRGQAYKITWNIGGQQSLSGTAVGSDTALAAANAEWIVLYQRDTDGTLKGVWTSQNGATLGLEVLTPQN